MLVGFAPGGGTDTTARALTPKLGERLGQQVIVDNRPGAAGNIATELTVKSPADGYTILMGTIAALSINPSLYGNLPFRSAHGSRARHACSGLDQHTGRASVAARKECERADRLR